MNVIVRDARPEDIEAVARVHVQGWRESYADFLSADALAGLSVEERVALWRRVFDEPDPRSCFLLASVAGEVVGFARGGPVRSQGEVPLGTEAEIYAIYLLNRAKRQGIGRRLMQGVFAHLAGQGFASCGLWVLTGNEAARRFYEVLGGVPGPEQPITLRGETVMETAYRFDPIPRL